MRDNVPHSLPQQKSAAATTIDINATLSKINAKIESAQRKMEKHSVVLKRESKEFDDKSDSKHQGGHPSY
jgi:hypothetical protein